VWGEQGVCAGVALQAGVWYHLAWAYAAPDPTRPGPETGGSVTLMVNGRVQRRVTVNASAPWPLGRAEEARARGWGRVELALGRDPGLRAQPGRVVVDEVWLFGEARSVGDVRDLMSVRARKHSRLGGPGAVDWMGDGGLLGGDVVETGGADAEDRNRLHGPAGLAEADGLAGECVKAAPYYRDEGASGGRCGGDCDCCGARNCSEHGWCRGDPALPVHPDCAPLPPAPPSSAAPPPQCPPGMFPPCVDGVAAASGCVPWQCAGGPGSRAAVAYDDAWDGEVQVGAGMGDGGGVRDYAQELLGLYDVAGVGLKSFEAGVTISVD
jgi:hypothetical protein